MPGRINKDLSAYLGREVLVCFFPFVCRFCHRHSIFSSHMEQIPGAPNKAAEKTDARFSGSVTPVKPAIRFKSQKLNPPPRTLPKMHRTGRPVLRNKKHMKIPRPHTIQISIFHSPVMPTKKAAFPSRDFCSFASRSKKR